MYFVGKSPHAAVDDAFSFVVCFALTLLFRCNRSEPNTHDCALNSVPTSRRFHDIRSRVARRALGSSRYIYFAGRSN